MLHPSVVRSAVPAHAERFRYLVHQVQHLQGSMYTTVVPWACVYVVVLQGMALIRCTDQMVAGQLCGSTRAVVLHGVF